MTFSDSRTSEMVDVVTVNVTCRPAAASASMNSTSAAPSSALISITGMSCGTLAEPKSGPERSSLFPSLKMITASAPASTAFAIFS